MPPVGYSQNRRQLVQPLISITTMSVPVTAVVTIPVRVSPAIIVPMAMMPWGNDHHVGRVKHRRAHDQRRRVVRPRCHNDCRGTHRSRGNEHGRRADGRDGRADHARRRWEAEGEGEVEFRPRRGGDCEPESEGTDSDYGFGFHNGRIDEGRPGRFEKCPLIELIGASGVGNSEGRRLPNLKGGAADRSLQDSPERSGGAPRPRLGLPAIGLVEVNTLWRPKSGTSHSTWVMAGSRLPRRSTASVL